LAAAAAVGVVSGLLRGERAARWWVACAANAQAVTVPSPARAVVCGMVAAGRPAADVAAALEAAGGDLADVEGR
jgi:hypothetical protein